MVYESFVKGIVFSGPGNLETSMIKQREDQKMHFMNMQQHLNKTVAVKRAALESLSLCHSTVQCTSVVKEAKTNNKTIIVH